MPRRDRIALAMLVLLCAGVCAIAWGCGELLRPASAFAAARPFAWPTAAWAWETARPIPSLTPWPARTRVPAGTREVVYVILPTHEPSEGPELVPLSPEAAWVRFVYGVHGNGAETVGGGMLAEQKGTN